MVAGSRGEVFQAQIPMPETGCFYPPTLITGLEAADRLMQEEIFGPVLVGTTFRTPEEAVASPTTRATGSRRRSGRRT
jgi:aldehyde dehydrogenase (NAD+)